VAQNRSRYEPEVVNKGLVVNVESHERQWEPVELVLQVSCSGVVRDLSRTIYESAVGKLTSSTVVNLEGESSVYIRVLRLTCWKPDEQAYALRSNEDVEMYDLEDEEGEEEAVMDELDGNMK
jgi:hypothetical protein